MKYLILIATLIFASASAHAELTIFDVRKSLAMSDDDKTYRDFYVNGGSEAGLTNGMIITVQRRMPLYDSYQNRSAGDLDLKVAKVKIIHVQRGLAVARLYSEFTRENAPLLEDAFIMVGDNLDLSTATTEKKGGRKADGGSESEDTVASINSAAPASMGPQILINSVELSSQSPAPSQFTLQ